MKSVVNRLARLAWICFFCGQPASGEKCANCNI